MHFVGRSSRFRFHLRASTLWLTMAFFSFVRRKSMRVWPRLFCLFHLIALQSDHGIFSSSSTVASNVFTKNSGRMGQRPWRASYALMWYSVHHGVMRAKMNRNVSRYSSVVALTDATLSLVVGSCGSGLALLGASTSRTISVGNLVVTP
jgi:hypothetical protein